MLAPIPADEAARLAALRAYEILDTPSEAAFERIASLASRMLDMPITAVSFVDRDRQWFKAIVGLEVSETSRDLSFCAHAILGDEVLVVPDTAADPRFADNALVTGEPGIRFYAGAPLHTPEGQALGALCVIDQRPREFDQRQRHILRDLAALVVDELKLRREIVARREAEAALIVQHRILQDAHDSVERRVKARTTELTEINETLQSEIRRRQLADEERDRSEHRFRQLFNQATEAAFVHDVDGWLVDLNDAACALLGYSREELLRMNVRDFTLDHVPAEGVPFWRELAVGSTEKFECRDRRKDGSELLVEVHATVLDTPQGRRLLALVRDITELRRNEELLRTRAREQEAAARLGTLALGGVGGHELLQEAISLVGATLGVDVCRVHEHLRERGLIVVRASLIPGGLDIGTIVSDDHEGVMGGYVLRTAQPILIEDTDTERRFRLPAWLQEYGVKSALCTVIGGPNPGDLRFGLLVAAARERRKFTEDDVFFVQSVANVLAAAIMRRRKEDDLRAVEARYRRISAKTPGVIYQYALPANGVPSIPFISESCRVLHGREAREIQKDPQLMLDAIHPEDLLGFVDAALNAERRLLPLQWQGRHLLPDGEVRWVRVDSRPERLPDGGVIYDGIIIDVTEETLSKEALRLSEERFRLAIVHLPFPVMLHTDDGEVMQVNDAWTHLTGYVAREMPNVEDWVTHFYASEQTRAQVRAFVADLANHIGAVEYPGAHIRCADGGERIWDFTSANLDRLPDGRWLHITTAIDVTERHQGEAALRAAKDEAERANHAKTVFLSRMSHELRTPLNAILGFGQILELSPLGEQETMSLGYILKGGRHLLALIDEVLDLSRAETGHLHLTPGRINVGALAHECVALVTRLAEPRGITCRVDVPGGLALWADEQRLRQMLLNLLSNAVKYNREGGAVAVSSEETSPGRLRIKVRDTGPGIPPEGMARLFVPFERLEQEFSEAEGTGLGLVISRRISEAMGGSLGVESEPGRGSTFWIELPLTAPPPTAEAAPVPASAELRLPTPVPCARLLYIEDNVSNLQVVKAMLANCRPSWEFLSAREGREGLALAQRSRPDLILLDLHLPGINGDAVLAELRLGSLTRDIPVILLSADATVPSRERLLAHGAVDYISKPFKLESLLERLDWTLQGRDGSPSRSLALSGGPGTSFGPSFQKS